MRITAPAQHKPRVSDQGKEQALSTSPESIAGASPARHRLPPARLRAHAAPINLSRNLFAFETKERRKLSLALQPVLAPPLCAIRDAIQQCDRIALLEGNDSKQTPALWPKQWLSPEIQAELQTCELDQMVAGFDLPVCIAPPGQCHRHSLHRGPGSASKL